MEQRLDELVKSPVVPFLKEVTPEDIHISQIAEKLGTLTLEATKNFDAKDWTVVSQEMVKLFNLLPEWNDQVLQSLDTVFTDGLQKISTEGNEIATKDFINRWHGWVGEAVVARLYNEIGAGKLQSSPKLDRKGVDGFVVVASPDDSYYVFLQIKALRGLKTGVAVFDPNKTGYYAPIPDSQNRQITTDQILRERKTYERLLANPEPGDIYTFCQEQVPEIREKFLKKNPDINPDTHKSHMVVLAVGVGMEAKKEKQFYGWKESMRAIQQDSEGDHSMRNAFSNDLFNLLPIEEAEK